ncbi:MAG: hypothetical protein ACTSPY_05510 [Candidatus Helarchaeota archaeon]
MVKGKFNNILSVFIIFLIIFPTYSILIPFSWNYIDENFKNQHEIEFNKLENNFNEIYYRKDPNFLPMKILTVIEEDENSYFDEFLYLSSIPISIFTFQNKRFLMPQIFSPMEYYKTYFLEDWKQFCDKWGGVDEIVYAGNLSIDTVNSYNNLLGVSSNDNTNFNSTDLFNITSEIAQYFWYKPDTVILAFANSSFSEPEIIKINESGNLTANSYSNYLDNLSSTNLIDIYSNLSSLLNTGAYYFSINDSNSFILNLKGNMSDGSDWLYDTNQATGNKWVFFPRVSYPGNLSEWKLEVVNRTNIAFKSYDLTAVNLSYYEKSLTILEDYTSMNINLNWTSISNEDLDLWVISPNGELVKGPIRNAFTQSISQNSEHITLYYPEQGVWKILITGNQNQTIPFNISIKLEKENDYFLNCIESATNGAVISSLLNYPLLYINNNSIPNSTLEAIQFLNPSKCIILSPRLEISPTIYTILNQTGVQQFENLTSYTDIVFKIKSISSEPDFIITSSLNGNFAPSTYLAAYHGAPVILSDNLSYNIHQKSLETYSQLERTVFQNPFGKNSLNQSVPIFDDMTNLSNTFYNWLADMNADYPENKTVIIVEALDELYPTFDRAIIGKSIVGRFGSQFKDENTILIMNNIYYPILSFINLTKKYIPLSLNIGIEENSTITQFNSSASLFNNSITATYSDDALYHSYTNSSNGYILMPYAINFSNYNIVIENITSINITVIARISYSNVSIIEAGWGIYNWSLNDLQLINTTIFNTTSDQLDYYYISADQISDYLNENNNNRSEIFFFVNTTNGNITLDVNYIKYQVQYQKLVNSPNSLSSSIVYYHNFSYNSQIYNFSEFIPENLTASNYNNKNHTGDTEILSILNNISLWYYSGDVLLNDAPFSNNCSILFLDPDSWRGYNSGGNPSNPDPSNQNFVYPETILHKWTSNSQLNSTLNNIHSKSILLQSSLIGSTDIPRTLLLHGATTVICNIRANDPGYSELLIYETLQNILNNQNITIGESLLLGINQTSHLYSKNWRKDLNEPLIFPNSTEDSLQYILFGDPEIQIFNENTIELKPGNYRPLVHAFLNFSYRDRVTQRQVEPFGPVENGRGQLWASITDLDSNPIIYLNITNSELGANPLAEFHDLHHYIPISKVSSSDTLNLYGYTFNWRGITIFDRHWTPGFVRESLGWKNTVWAIYDEDVNFTVSSSFNLRSNPPFLNYFGPLTNTTRFLLNTTGSNDTTTFENISHQLGNLHENIWRVNNTFWVRLKIVKTDQNSSKHINNELNISLLISQNYTLPFENWSQISLDNETSSAPYDAYQAEYGIWNASFNFEGNKTGKYWFAVIIEDEWGEKAYYKDYDEWYFFVNNWLPEFDYQYPNPTRLNTTDLYRVNETISINVSLFDRDGNPGVKQVYLLFNNSLGDTINLSMIDISGNGLNWSRNYTFTQFNKSGQWYLYFYVIDIDNASRILNSSIIINVSNWAPDHPFGLNILNLSTQQIQYRIYRNKTLLLLANATDIDIANRTAQLNLSAFIRAPNDTIYTIPMIYSKNYSLWTGNFTPSINYILGNYTYFVGVYDELGAMSNSTESINLTILNNKPIIVDAQICVGVDRIPNDRLNVGVELAIKMNVSDVEGLHNVTVFIEDEFGNSINLTQTLSGQYSQIILVFNSSLYSTLEIHQQNDWRISMVLFDTDNSRTGNFTLDDQFLNQTIIHIIPQYIPPNYEFPVALIIAIAIVIMVILATYFVYKNIRQKEVIVPVKDVKRIIKQISEEEKEKKEEKEEEPAEEIQKIPKKEKIPVKLSQDEIEEIKSSIKENLETIKIAIEKEQFKRAAELYRYISNLAVSIDKQHMANVYLEKAAEFDELDKTQPKKKKKWKKPKESKEPTKEKLEAAEPGELTQEEFEAINIEIGTVTRKARESLRNEDYETAIELYQYAAKLAYKINNRRKSSIFSKRAKELLRKLEE